MICNTEDVANPDIRARLVACEVNTFKSDDVFASTPPLEAKRILLSEMATARRLPDGRPLEMTFIDIRKAYFNGIPCRQLHLFLPKELCIGTTAVAHRRRCVYGTRAACMSWEDCYAQALIDLGFAEASRSQAVSFMLRSVLRLSSTVMSSPPWVPEKT